MEPTKMNNRSLLRPRTTKKRGNPIFVFSQAPLREPVPINICESETLIRVNEVIEPEQSSSSVKCLTALTNKRGDTSKEDLSDLTKPGTHRSKRQRTDDNILCEDEEDKKCDEHDFFVVSLPLIALEKRLDFGSRCDDNKCRPCTMAETGKIHPKEILLSIINPSSDSNEQHGGISTFRAFNTAFGNKLSHECDSQEASSEVESLSLATKRHRDNKNDEDTTNEEPRGPSEKKLQAEESSSKVENKRDTREKRVCKSAFDLVRLMELRRVGLAKPPKNPAKHIQLVKRIQKCMANLSNKSCLNDDAIAKSSVVNQEIPTIEDLELVSVEDLYYTLEYNNDVSLMDNLDNLYTAVEDRDINASTVTSPAKEDNEDDISCNRPILKRRINQSNSWEDIGEGSRCNQKGVSFKDRLNPIAAAEYEEMEVIELDMYDDLPNQFRSDVPKEFTRHWSTQDTDEFYKCIALLGLDFGRIATVMGRTQKQITNKYKTEQKKNNQRLHNALVRQGEFFEYRKRYKF